MPYALTTAENIYKAVLDGIKKESTAVLTPTQFNRLMNTEALIEWMKDKAGSADLDQHFVDALRNLYKYSPEIDITQEGFPLPNDYYRLQSVSFKLWTNDSKTILSDWLPVKRMKADTLSVMKVNPFRAASDTRLYYYQQGNFVVNYPQNEKVAKARLFYLSMPQPITYEPGGTNENGNLLPEQNKEVVDIAVRIIVERVKEERYQTVLIEENLKSQKSNN